MKQNKNANEERHVTGNRRTSSKAAAIKTVYSIAGCVFLTKRFYQAASVIKI
jgi:hypothetical protein